MGNRANYVRTLSPVERILGYFLWDQVSMNVTKVHKKTNDFVATDFGPNKRMVA